MYHCFQVFLKTRRVCCDRRQCFPNGCVFVAYPNVEANIALEDWAGTETRARILSRNIIVIRHADAAAKAQRHAEKRRQRSAGIDTSLQMYPAPLMLPVQLTFNFLLFLKLLQLLLELLPLF